VKEHRLASEELRTALRSIAEQLQKTASASGKWVRKDDSQGYDLNWEPDPPNDLGLNKVTFINVNVQLWRELGSILEDIAEGKCARRLFGQHLRTNPAKDGEHRLRALAYWSARARAPSAEDAEALELARAIAPTAKTLKPGTIRKYAQRHRMRCLCLLSFPSCWLFKFESSGVEIRALGQDIGPLVHYLQKKEGRESWRKSALFSKATDVLYIRPADGDDDASAPPAFPGMSLNAEELPPGASLRIERRDAIVAHMRVTNGGPPKQE
jgi:hypothetical protein